MRNAVHIRLVDRFRGRSRDIDNNEESGGWTIHRC